MTVIGVVDTEDRAARVIREYLSATGHPVAYLSCPQFGNAAFLSRFKCEYLVIYMNRQLCDITFDLLILCGKPQSLSFCRLPPVKMLLISADRFTPPTDSVAFGLGSAACVTASSIQAELDALQFCCCVQHTFSSLNGDITYPGETPVSIYGYQIPIEAGLAGLTGLLALGLKLEETVRIML